MNKDLTYNFDITPIIKKFEQAVAELEIKHEGKSMSQSYNGKWEYLDDWCALHKMLYPIAHLIPLKEQLRLEVSNWINDWEDGKIVRDIVEIKAGPNE